MGGYKVSVLNLIILLFKKFRGRDNERKKLRKVDNKNLL